MAFKAKKYVDQSKRQSFSMNEVFSNSSLSLVNNEIIPYTDRQSLYNSYIRRNPRRFSITRIKNRCLITNRSKGIVKFFRLSRISFREKARNGDLLGVVRGSW